jgi:predicted transcriptional regulator
MPNKQNKKGRSKAGPAFVQLFHYVRATEAWRSLSAQDRAVYLELLFLFNGRNNGWLALSVRDAAARANVAKDTANRSLQTLQERGFIECTQEGAFSYKVRHAAEYRLSHVPCDKTGKPPSRAFRTWRAANASPKFSACCPKSGTDEDI